MFKFMMLFRQPQDIAAFENSYNDLLALVERMPQVIRRQVINVVGSPAGISPYYRILEVYFADQRTMQNALLSKAGQEAGGEMSKFPAGAFEMIFADVYEEQGGSTNQSQGDGS
jgi:uncharacterized protein (TIGR02118 family)